MGINQRPPTDLIGRRLVTASSCYYASYAYLEEHDPQRTDSDARWIGWDDDGRFPAWVTSSPFPQLPAHGKFNSVPLQVQAAVKGMGLAILPCFVGDTAQGLRRVPGCRPHENYDIWLLSHPDQRDTARLRIFREFVVGSFEQNKGLLTGRGSTPVLSAGA